MIDAPVLIASAPRSGSSVTAHCVSTLGYFGGQTKAGDEYNPQGYFENQSIEALVIGYLQRYDDYNLGKQFQPYGLNRPCVKFRERVLSRLKEQGRQQQPWFYKDTKTPLVWPLWDRYFPTARWVLVERDRDRTLASIERVPFMNQYQKRYQWHAYLDRYERLLDDIRSHVQYSHTVNANAFLRGEAPEVAALAEYLDCGEHTYSAKAVIDPSIPHQRTKS